jgi:hypothetical protein
MSWITICPLSARPSDSAPGHVPVLRHGPGEYSVRGSRAVRREISPRITAVSAIDRDVKDFPGLGHPGGRKGAHPLGRAEAARRHRARPAVDPEFWSSTTPFSAVDKETEERILEPCSNGERADEHHRLKPRLHAAPRRPIAVLDSGSLAQYGTHEELLAREGFYSEIARMQALAREPSAGGDPGNGAEAGTRYG